MLFAYVFTSFSVLLTVDMISWDGRQDARLLDGLRDFGDIDRRHLGDGRKRVDDHRAHDEGSGRRGEELGAMHGGASSERALRR